MAHEDRGSTTGHPVMARTTPPDAVLDLIRPWLERQRWFPAKGSAEPVERIAVLELTDPAGQAEVRVELLRLPWGGALQVPLVLRTDDATPSSDEHGQERADGPEVAGLVGRLPASADRPAVLVVDGCHDAAFLRAWLSAAEHEASATGHRAGGDAASGVDAVSPSAAPPLADQLMGMRVLTGEQSNTSVLLPAAVPPAILKVFRTVNPGANPDVEVPLALSRAGWRGVPRPLAWLTGAWPAGPHADDDHHVGHLGVLSELVVGAEDGFELACRHARQGEDFGDLAHDLGRTTAQMHHALREALPVDDAGQGPGAAEQRAGSAEDLDADRTAVARTVVDTLRARAAGAIEAAPVLAARSAAIDRVLAAVGQLADLPALQRVHGDFHLGQVLRSPTRGWAVLDFEGEPQASADERTRPDLALRDLAGMLRSIDYAAAVGAAPSPRWSQEARTGLVTGYREEVATQRAPGADAAHDAEVTDVLLRALELDKALYEVVYESRNRPAWLPIPLRAVDRLVADGD